MEQRKAPAVQIGTLKVGDTVCTMAGLVCVVEAVSDDGLMADVRWLNLTRDVLLAGYPVHALDRASRP